MNKQAQTPFEQLLKRCRIDAGLTQAALAARAGVSRRSIQALERGDSKPQKETARLLASALELETEEREQFLTAAGPAPRRTAITAGGPGGRGSRLPAGSAPAGDPQHENDTPPPLAPFYPVTAPVWATPPIPPTTLVGRAAEVAAVGTLLQRDDRRLVTLTGPGGVGKTRLALEVVTTRSLVADAVVFVPLAPLNDADLVMATIAAALGLHERGTQPLLTGLATYLRDKHLLLVLDNFEHLVEAAPDIAALQRTCADLKVLATSRIPLRLQGEQLFPVAPLPLPDPALQPLPALAVQADAVRLFVQRATMVKPNFVLNAANVPAVAAITRQLDGLPLAIELAAAHTAVLSPQAMLERLAHPLTLLTAGARDLPGRHQTLRDTVAWSYNLLSLPEQALFRRLSVFAGGCLPEAAAAICKGAWAASDLLTGMDLPAGLISLVEKSLLQVEEPAVAEGRFGMLATIREYGREQLEIAGEADAVRRRHAAYFLEFAEDAVPHLAGAEQLAWLARLDQELDNLRIAFAGCMEWGMAGDAGAIEQGLRVAGKLYRYWHLRGRYSEGLMWLERLLTAPAEAGPTIGRARALQTSAVLKASTGDRAAAYAQSTAGLAICQQLGDQRELAHALHNIGSLDVTLSPPEAWLSDGGALQLEEALRLLRELDDQAGVVQAVLWLGFRLLRSGEFIKAAARFTEGLTIAQTQGDRWSMGMALTGLAESTWLQGDIGTARTLARQSLEQHQALGDRHGSGHVLGLLGDLAQAAGDTVVAWSYYQRSLEVLRAMGEVPRSIRTLWGLATLAATTDEPIRALLLAGAATALSQTALVSAYSPDDARLAPLRAVANARLSPEEQAAAWATGQAMSLEQAIALALHQAD